MRSIGLFGGTFDPPHIGHLILAAEARAEFKLDRLLWILTLASPLKQARSITGLPHRLRMLELALAEDPGFELSRVDIDRPGPYYAVDTVRLITAQHPEAEITYLMGGDSLRDLPLWHDPVGFVAVCGSIGVLRRPEDSVDMEALEQQIPGITKKVRFMDAPLLDIAARDIRQRVAQGRPFRYYLPPKVYEYIVENGLYVKDD